MPIQINEQTYYGIPEICKAIGISRATLYRWLKAGLLDKSYKNRRGYRLFTQDDLSLIQSEASKVKVDYYADHKKE